MKSVNVATLLRCYVATLLCCYVATLLCCYVAMLLCCYVATLLRCLTLSASLALSRLSGHSSPLSLAAFSPGPHLPSRSQPPPLSLAAVSPLARSRLSSRSQPSPLSLAAVSPGITYIHHPSHTFFPKFFGESERMCIFAARKQRKDQHHAKDLRIFRLYLLLLLQ